MSYETLLVLTAKSVLDGTLFAMLGIGFFIHVRKTGTYTLSYNAPFALWLAAALFLASLQNTHSAFWIGCVYAILVALSFPVVYLFSAAFTRTQQTLFFIASATVPVVVAALHTLLIGVETSFFASIMRGEALLVAGGVIALLVAISIFVAFSRQGIMARAALLDIEMFRKISYRSEWFLIVLDASGYCLAAAGFFFFAAFYGFTIHAQVSLLLYQFIIYEFMAGGFSPGTALLTGFLVSVTISTAVFVIGAQWEYALVGAIVAGLLVLKRT